MKLNFKKLYYKVFNREEIIHLGFSPIPKNALYVLALCESVGHTEKNDFIVKDIKCWSENKSVLDKLAKAENNKAI